MASDHVDVPGQSDGRSPRPSQDNGGPTAPPGAVPQSNGQLVHPLTAFHISPPTDVELRNGQHLPNWAYGLKPDDIISVLGALSQFTRGGGLPMHLVQAYWLGHHTIIKAVEMNAPETLPEYMKPIYLHIYLFPVMAARFKFDTLPRNSGYDLYIGLVRDRRAFAVGRFGHAEEYRRHNAIDAEKWCRLTRTAVAPMGSLVRGGQYAPSPSNWVPHGDEINEAPIFGYPMHEAAGGANMPAKQRRGGRQSKSWPSYQPHPGPQMFAAQMPGQLFPPGSFDYPQGSQGNPFGAWSNAMQHPGSAFYMPPGYPQVSDAGWFGPQLNFMQQPGPILENNGNGPHPTLTSWPLYPESQNAPDFGNEFLGMPIDDPAMDRTPSSGNEFLGMPTDNPTRDMAPSSGNEVLDIPIDNSTMNRTPSSGNEFIGIPTDNSTRYGTPPSTPAESVAPIEPPANQQIPPIINGSPEIAALLTEYLANFPPADNHNPAPAPAPATDLPDTSFLEGFNADGIVFSPEDLMMPMDVNLDNTFNFPEFDWNVMDMNVGAETFQ
ncbi:MAG: hypothetical protein Q9169_008045 [Polycauliona sp. 2 TL-2023]